MIRIAVLISGSGTTLKNLIAHRDAGRLPIEIVLVVSSKQDAGGLEFASHANIPHQVIQRRDHESTGSFSDAIFAACHAAEVDLVIMGGFLAHVLIPAAFQNRVINIHPSLIPKFCGKGFYGMRVHEAVIAAGESVSGCTVHFVDDEYDHGPIILQRSVPVERNDTAESLAKRVFAVECDAYPEAIRLVAAKRMKTGGDKVDIEQ